jgi:hypothetical protein
MELRRKDPDSGGSTTLLKIDPEDGEVHLGRNPVTQITDTLISRKHATVCFDKKSLCWTFKSAKKVPS